MSISKNIRKSEKFIRNSLSVLQWPDLMLKSKVTYVTMMYFFQCGYRYSINSYCIWIISNFKDDCKHNFHYFHGTYWKIIKIVFLVFRSALSEAGIILWSDNSIWLYYITGMDPMRSKKNSLSIFFTIKDGVKILYLIILCKVVM